jgi:DNA-binding CsgD family transcriptional regulator
VAREPVPRLMPRMVAAHGSLADACYEGVADRRSWRGVLEQVRGALAADGVYLVGSDWSAEDAARAATTGGRAGQWVEAPRRRRLASDCWPRSVAGLEPGEVYSGEEILAASGTANTLSVDFLRLQAGFHSLNLVIERQPEVITGLSACRRRSHPPFDAAARELLRDLGPDLRRALALQRMVLRERVRAGALAGALEVLSTAVVVVDGGLRVLHLNQSALALMREATALRLEGETLATASSPGTRRLRRLVEAVIGSPEGVVRGMRLHRDSSPPLEVLVRSNRADGTALATVTAVDPARLAPEAATIQAELYGLTPSETRLARELALGRELAEAAGVLGMSPDSARFHHRHLLAKVGARHASELVERLVRVAG